MSIKEMYLNTKKTISEKWKEANKKYPWLKPVLIGCGIAFIGGSGYYIYKKNNSTSSDIDFNPNNPYAGMITTQTETEEGIVFQAANRATSNESLRELWEREYKDNWDEVMECARRLSLKPGEMFIIEDQTPFIGNPSYDKLDPSRPIVSHFIDNVGVYPPEE